jgi:HPt (histidine-containing phosphotransfer) domain-containing protein
MSIQAAIPPLFDPGAIEQLRKVAGDEASIFIAEVAQLFLQETRKSLVELQRAAAAGDRDGAARIAHSLKSSAATLGLMRLSEACQQLETDAKGATSSDDSALVAAVFARFEETVPILRGLS